jgi:hypothetical protein
MEKEIGVLRILQDIDNAYSLKYSEYKKLHRKQQKRVEVAEINGTEMNRQMK